MNFARLPIKKKEFLANGIFVFLSVAIALIEALRIWFCPQDVSREEIYGAILWVLGFLSSDRLLEAFHEAGERTMLEQVNAQLLRMETTYKTPTRLVPCPDNDPSVYAHLFGGFTGVFYAYNPHYSIESIEGGSASLDLNPTQRLLITKVYIPRYCTTDHCEAHYLFFTGDVYGKNDLEKFKQMMRAVLKESPNSCIKACLKVKQIKDRATKDQSEIYFGTQHNKPTVIHDLSEPGVQHGRPSYYCVAESEEFLKNCRRTFELDWDNPSVSIPVTNQEIFGD